MTDKEKKLQAEAIDYLRKRIEELEKACEETQELLDKQIEATYRLDKENAELKEKLLERKQYIEFRCNEAVKKKEVYEREHYLLTKAKEIIKKLKALYLYPVITKNDVKRQDEILSEAEQFLKYSEVEK